MDIKSIRKTYGLSQQRFAQHLGISKSYVSQLEKGNRTLSPVLEEKIKNQFLVPPEKELHLKASFDWLSLHFKSCELARIVSELLQVELEQFTLEDYGRYRYPLFYRYGDINVYANPADERQGVTIECTGTGCRQLEALLQEQKRDWYDLFNECLLYENERRRLHQMTDEENTERYFNVTRLDLALDETYCETGNYSLFSLYERFNQGLVSSRKHQYRAYIGGKMAQGRQEHDGLTLYIGSRKSPLFLRFYEKDVEQARKMEIPVEAVHDLYGYKNRYEIVMRKERADWFIRDYVATYFDLAKKAVAIINSQLIVYSDPECRHLDEEWTSLMSETSVYPFQMTPKVINLDQTWAWAEKSVFPTLRFLKAMDEEKFNDFMAEASIPKRYLPYLKAKKEELRKNNDKNEKTLWHQSGN